MAFTNGASRASGRVSARAVLKVLTLVAVVAVALGAPRAAEASEYVWKGGDGYWDVEGNWDHTPFSGPKGLGYPNLPGDRALFTGTYASAHNVAVPDGVLITVGTIIFGDHGITIRGDGSGRLRLDNGTFAPQIIRIGVPLSSLDLFDIPVELRNNVDVTQSDALANMVMLRTISNSGGAFGITKKGPGRLYLRGRNGYLGTTSVEAGTLILDQPDGSGSIEGNLEIGSGVAGPGIVAEVVVSKQHQVADASRVLIKSQGLLTVDVLERFGEVIVNDGFITVRTAAGLFVTTDLTLSGGTVESQTGGRIRLDGPLTATSSANRASRIFRSGGGGTLDLGSLTHTFTINDGPSFPHDLSIDLPITGTGVAGVLKVGPGIVRFTASNNYIGGTYVQVGALWLEPPAGGQSLIGSLEIGGGPQPANVSVRQPGAIGDFSLVAIGANGSLWINATTPETIGALEVFDGGSVSVGNLTPSAGVVTSILRLQGGLVEMFQDTALEVTNVFSATSRAQRSSRITGGTLLLGGARTIDVPNGPEAIDFHVSSKILGAANDGLRKSGDGVAVLTASNPYGGATAITAGTLVINGQQPASPIALTGGTLGGSGRTGLINAGAATVAPGESPGRLSSGSITFTPATIFRVELNGTDAGSYDQLAVTGTVNLGDSRLGITFGATPSADARWTIIDNDGTDPVAGTFFQTPEGRAIEIGGHEYRITYRGGDGNDVVIENLGPPTYYLAEGATGAFFDDDVLIANPNNVEAPVTMTFLREGGATVVVQRVIPARSRVTIHVDQLEGLEDASASVKVESTNKLPLVVERTMFWDASYYGGHTANAVRNPEKQWTFAEGFQGFFDTYILIANANGAPTTATLTFLREDDTPVVKTVDVGPFTRKTVYTGDYDELKGRAFGIVVDATEPVIAERAMYFATQPGRLWAGGHVNTGIIAPSRSWFHAEGATGTFFSTFILLSNPQSTEAKIEVRFLLDNGTVITRQKTLAPQQRLTINPAAEGDSRLENAAVSTVVSSDVPIVSERSMYWEGDVAKALGEGHNSSGIAEAGVRWGLSEGRVGGDREFDTYILLANPSDAAAKVRVTYLRETGAPIVKEYDVSATSRFNIDVKTVVPELRNSSFGADIEVLNSVPIAVERSMYWNALDSFWAGGTNALATPLRPVP